MKLDNSFRERKSLGHDVFEYLKNAIIDQTIEPGSRLVESKIAEMLGISRTPLREALHKLEREDWIEKIPFSETRNYVQRVMENLQVYRRLEGSEKLRLAEDLVR